MLKENRLLNGDERVTIKRLLAERISLRGICRVMSVSLRWLMDYAVQYYETALDDLNVRL